MPISATSGSIKASDVLLAIKNRLIEITNDPDGTVDESFVRVVAHPGPDYANYRAERGIALCMSAPQPFTNAGAGRYGLKTTRIVEVHIGTQNLLDPAHNDQIAVFAHLDLEETVVDALHDASPLTGYSPATSDPAIPTGPRHIGLKVRWIPGGSEIARLVKTDAGLLFSVILFEVEYVPPLQVTL